MSSLPPDDLGRALASMVLKSRSRDQAAETALKDMAMALAAKYKTEFLNNNYHCTRVTL
jgi:hypothetical protein